MKFDPFTASIIQDQLIAAAEESFIRLGRSSQSPIIYEVLDYACAITDRNGDLIAQANGVPGFLGTLTFAVKAVIEKYSKEDLRPGDMFITNDPYSGGGNHLSDVALIAPIFYKEVLIAFSVNKAHWTEVGGMAAGSWTTDSTEIYQEGLQFPIIYLGKNYEPDQSLVDLIAANVRTPDRTLGDMYAGIASLRAAERRLHEIVKRYGLKTFLQSVSSILEKGENTALRALKALPKGSFFAEDWMDDDGLSDRPVYVRVNVTITDTEFIADFTGSSPQVRGPINSTRTRLFSACRSIFKSITNPASPVNDGWFRPVKVICPDGTVFTAVRPAAVSTYWETGAYAVDLIWRALFPVLSDRLTAGHSLSVCGTIISGKTEDGKDFILVEPQAGGWGAGATKDGESGLVVVGDGETYIMPVEVCESRYPLLIDQYGFHKSLKGNGKFRGGFGLIKDYRVLCDKAQITATFGRHKYPPWGWGGGQDGSSNGVMVLPKESASPVIWKGKLARYPLKGGDVARLITGTGGGYGDTKERDPVSVQKDVKNGFFSLPESRDIYAVELNPNTMEINWKKTAQLRKRYSNKGVSMK
jgi:N-methylhydantoinase B